MSEDSNITELATAVETAVTSVATGADGTTGTTTIIDNEITTLIVNGTGNNTSKVEVIVSYHNSVCKVVC